MGKGAGTPSGLGCAPEAAHSLSGPPLTHMPARSFDSPSGRPYSPMPSSLPSTRQRGFYSEILDADMDKQHAEQLFEARDARLADAPRAATALPSRLTQHAV